MQNPKYKDCHRIMVRNGYSVVDIKGSHVHYRNADNRHFTLAIHNGCVNGLCWKRVVKDSNIEL